MKKILLVVLTLNTLIALGQQEILNFKNLDFDRGKKNVENYSLINTETEELLILLAQNKKVQAYLYNRDFKNIKKASATHLKRKYKEAVGYSIFGNRYTMVFATDNRKKFGYISIDMDSGESTTDELDFRYDNEKYLETIIYKNRLIMMSATKENTLTLREFTPEFTFKELAALQLANDDREQRLLPRSGFFNYDFFGSFKNTVGGISKIDNRVPNSIERTSKQNKLYHNDNIIIITFEDEESNTLLNIINLDDFTLKTKSLGYPDGKLGDLENFNSFIYDNNIFHLGSSRDEMIFQVKDFDNNVIKEYYVDIDSEIDFKNSAIIQDGSTYSSGKRELETTKKYLRKITNGDIGLAIHEEDGVFQITLGSVEKIARGGGGFGGFPGAPTGVSVPIPGGSSVFVPTYNPAFTSYGGYSFTKAVLVHGLFDQNFDHIKGQEMNDNIFDRIQEYQDELKRSTAEDVFLYRGETYFSYWNVSEQRYTMVKF